MSDTRPPEVESVDMENVEVWGTGAGFVVSDVHDLRLTDVFLTEPSKQGEAMKYKVQIENLGSPSGGSVLHLIAPGEPFTVCGKVPSSRLKNAGGFDQEMCMECIQKLPPADGGIYPQK